MTIWRMNKPEHMQNVDPQPSLISICGHLSFSLSYRKTVELNHLRLCIFSIATMYIACSAPTYLLQMELSIIPKKNPLMSKCSYLYHPVSPNVVHLWAFFHLAGSNASSISEPDLEPVLCFSTTKASVSWFQTVLNLIPHSLLGHGRRLLRISFSHTRRRTE